MSVFNLLFFFFVARAEAGDNIKVPRQIWKTYKYNFFIIFCAGRINLVRRRCSNRTLTLTHHPLMKFLNPKTNISICVYQKALICAWLCDKDFCNGISNHSPIFSGDHNLVQFVVLLSVLFVFGFTETPHLTQDWEKVFGVGWSTIMFM